MRDADMTYREAEKLAARYHEPDPINPPHYTAGDIEFIDALESMLSPDEFRGFLRGSAAKYLWRLGRKGASVEDTKKAQWYIERLRAHLEDTK